jgi:hypothetical protein
MRKISKDIEVDRTRIASELRSAALDIEIARVAAVKAVDAMNDKIRVYNSLLEDARELRDGVVADMEEYMGDRSDRWRESEASQTYEEWKSAWEYAELDDVDMPDFEVDDLPGQESDHADALENLPATPGDE